MRVNNSKLYELFIFMLKFTILGIPLLWTFYYPVNFYELELFQANAVVSMLKISGLNVVLGDTLSPESFMKVPLISVEGLNTDVGIDMACTGYRSFYAFLALVISSPRVKWKRKGHVLLTGFVIVGLVNILRIFTTILLGLAFGEVFFEIIHTFLWRYGMLALVIFLWYVWLKRAALSRRVVSSP